MGCIPNVLFLAIVNTNLVWVIDDVDIRGVIGTGSQFSSEIERVSLFSDTSKIYSTCIGLTLLIPYNLVASRSQT